MEPMSLMGSKHSMGSTITKGQKNRGSKEPLGFGVPHDG